MWGVNNNNSYRMVFDETNAAGGVHTINFHLPGSGVHVMSITSGPLPVVTSPLILDGTSQPNCTVPCIVLSGAVVGGGYIGAKPAGRPIRWASH